jgi:hypothetical protein
MRFIDNSRQLKFLDLTTEALLMAVYYDLAIDCGENEQVADQAIARFKDLSIVLPGIAPISLRVSKEKRRDLWFVCVLVLGMGYGTHPFCRLELVKPENAAAIHQALYEHLKKLQGFRRAVFAAEAYDTFIWATPEEDNEIDFQDMVYSLQHFPTPAQGSIVSTFSEGYVVVTQWSGGTT